MKKWSELFSSEKTNSQIELLYYDGDVVSLINEHNKKKKRLFVSIISVTIILTVATAIFEHRQKSSPVESIIRNEYGRGDKIVKLITDYGNGARSGEITIPISEKRYNETELDTYLSKFEKEIEDVIRGENKSLDQVTTNLNLVTSLYEYPFSISWKSDNPLLLNYKGELNKDYLKEDVPVRLCASLKYDDYKRDLYFFVIVSKDRTKNYEKFCDDVMESIEIIDEESKCDDELILPRKVDGINIRYYKEPTYRSIVIALVGIICAIGCVISKDKEVDKLYNERCTQMDRDYSRILNQYCLYYCAGMNHRMIWNQICNRYEEKYNESGNKRFAYEEMIRTKNQLEDGVGEMVAYENFATRCKSIKYRSFVNLIEQSIKKGKERLDTVLEEEVEKSRVEENNRIRMAIQEMSTKLLFPMVMMLIIVIVIVIVPAFLSI